jgi:hypothetical protein
LGKKLKTGDEYTCASCGETLITTWDDDDALDEADELFPDEMRSGEPTEVICDTCHAEFMEWWEDIGYWKYRKMEEPKNG